MHANEVVHERYPTGLCFYFIKMFYVLYVCEHFDHTCLCFASGLCLWREEEGVIPLHLDVQVLGSHPVGAQNPPLAFCKKSQLLAIEWSLMPTHLLDFQITLGELLRISWGHHCGHESPVGLFKQGGGEAGLPLVSTVTRTDVDLCFRGI